MRTTPPRAAGAALCVLAPLAGVLLGFALLGASSANRPHGPSTDAATSQPPRRGGTIVYVQESAESLDPRDTDDVYESTIVYQVHRGLLQFGPNLTPLPGVARTWKISRDGLEYEFEIRPDVRFHNGRSVTADDVRYSLERIYEPGHELGIAGQSLTMIDGALDYHRGAAQRIRGIQVLGPRTLRIHLSRPSGSFLWSLAMAQTAIVPHDVVDRLGVAEFSRHPVGCGPFRVISHTPAGTRLAAFEDYFRGRPQLDSLVFVTPPTNATAVGVEMLRAGRASMAEVPGSLRKELSALPSLRIITGQELSLSFLGLNRRRPPLDNLHVRRALAFAVDRQAILRATPEDRIIPTGILPPGMSCYSPEARVLPFDRARARQELALAGYPDGRGLPPIRYVSSGSSARSRVTDSLLVSGWRSVGIPIQSDRLKWAELSKSITERSAVLFALSWVADLPDPDSFMGSLFASNSTYNYFSFGHATVDSLLERGREFVDPRMRQGIYREIEHRVLEDVAMVPLFNNTLTFATCNTVRGIALTPLGIAYVDFANVFLEGGSVERAELE